MSLKALQQRIVSTSNIEKITKSMKMVAAAKMKGTETRLLAGRTFGARTSEATFPTDPDFVYDEDDPACQLKTDAASNAMLLITSDKGLCGGVNSSITKTARLAMDKYSEAGNADNVSFSIIGDKGRSVIQRLYGDKLSYTMDETWRNAPNFAQASAIATRVMESDADRAQVVFNTFESAISYRQTIINCDNFAKGTEDKIAEGGSGMPEFFEGYEFEPESTTEALENLYEFGLASTIYYGMLESATSEESSRMAAMDNASKNAGEMIETLTLRYNRARQASITTELIEIISGAAALEG